MNTTEQARRGALAARAILSLPREVADRALGLFSLRLEEESELILSANAADLEAARASGLPEPLLKRLSFDAKKLATSRAGLAALRGLPDPRGRVLEARRLDEGLTLRRVSCPIGLVAMIFEARPDALIQMAGLAAKSGNALVLKGGREAAGTNRALARILSEAGVEAGLPEGWLVNLESREEVGELLALDEYVDLVIPRGSKEFVRHIMETSRIPVLGHAEGICHVYVHGSADPGMAARIAVDSKAQYPAACNAAEVLLMDGAIARRDLPPIAAALEAAGVRLELCPRAAAILAAASPESHNASMESPFAGAAGDAEDWGVEYLDLVMAVKVVEGLDDAIAHVNRFGSGHTDAIVASSRAAAERFMAEVDSSSVYWNASTRFADGYRYGLGAEVGISTGKLHARGPMGLSGLMTYKWRLEGEGQLVADYASGARSFRHEDIEAELGSYHG
jgi:glutamate-5-semialdehyde dehydrogenase